MGDRFVSLLLLFFALGCPQVGGKAVYGLAGGGGFGYVDAT